MLTYNFKLNFFLASVLAFMFFTVVGTLLHELGHISVAKFGFDYDTEMYYGSMDYYPEGYQEDQDVIAFQNYMEENEEQIESNTAKENKKLLAPYLKPIARKFKNFKESIWITAGGPLQTLLTSILGLLILYFRRSHQRKDFDWLDWMAVFLALFVSREVFNTVHALITEVFREVKLYTGDEFILSEYFGWGLYTFPALCMVFGVAVMLYVIFVVLPFSYRFSFILSGLVGGVLGFYLWFNHLGPSLLPIV